MKKKTISLHCCVTLPLIFILIIFKEIVLVFYTVHVRVWCLSAVRPNFPQVSLNSGGKIYTSHSLNHIYLVSSSPCFLGLHQIFYSRCPLTDLVKLKKSQQEFKTQFYGLCLCLAELNIWIQQMNENIYLRRRRNKRNRNYVRHKLFICFKTYLERKAAVSCL